MDRLVKSVTHNANPRPCTNKERRRSRGNRKSCKSCSCPCTLSHLWPCPDAFSPSLCVCPTSVALFPCPVPVLCPLSVPVPVPCPISVSLFLYPVPPLWPCLCTLSCVPAQMLCPIFMSLSHLCLYLCVLSRFCSHALSPCLVPSLCPCPHALPGDFPTGHP